MSIYSSEDKLLYSLRQKEYTCKGMCDLVICSFITWVDFYHVGIIRFFKIKGMGLSPALKGFRPHMQIITQTIFKTHALIF